MPLGWRSKTDETSRLDREALASLVSAAHVVNESSDLGATLRSILDGAIGLLSADEGSVMLFDTERRTLRIRAARGLPAHIIEAVQVPVGHGIAGYVAATGTPLLLASDDDVDRYAERRDRLRPLRAAVSVPLRTRDLVVGVLNVNQVEGRGGSAGFDESDLAIATLFAEFAAAAVHNTELYEAAQHRAEHLAQLFEAGHALSGAPDVPDVSERILDGIEQLAELRAGFTVALPEEGATPEVTAVRGVPQGRVKAVLRHDGFPELARGSNLRVVGEPETSPALAPLVAGRDDASVVIGPLSAGGDVRGLVVAIAGRAGPDDDQLHLLSTFLNHAAVALARATLFRNARTREDELTSLANSVPDPIVIADANGRILALNPAACELFGLNPQFDVGTPLAGKLRSAELEELLLGHQLPVREDVTVFTPTPRTFRARATQVRAGHGPLGARILTLEDVTADKEMEQLKADFVAVIGHELRTPLTLIKGYTGTLAKRGDALSADAREKALVNVNTQAQRLERLIEDLLLVSRVERHRPPLHVERLDLVEVLARCRDHVLAEHPDRDIALAIEVSQLPILADRTKVDQIMHHLLDNACKFSPADTTVTIEAEPRGSEIEVRVVDQGQGIFSGDVPRLFERFHQVDGSATRAHGGTGIGLYICRTLVEAHGGRIGVRSALGRGSTFWFRLPTEPPPPDDEDQER